MNPPKRSTLVLVLGLALLALASCGRPDEPTTAPANGGGPTEPKSSPVTPEPGTVDPRPIPWTKVDVADDDQTLTIDYVGGVNTCYALDRVDVDYGNDTVTVTVYEGARADLPPDTACIEIGVLKSVTVELGEPLGGRELVDGAL